MGELEFISVAAVHLALEQAGAIVRVYAIAVGDEEDDIASLIGGDILELLFEVADPLVSLSAPVALQRSKPEASCCRVPRAFLLSRTWRQQEDANNAEYLENWKIRIS